MEVAATPSLAKASGQWVYPLAVRQLLFSATVLQQPVLETMFSIFWHAYRLYR